MRKIAILLTILITLLGYSCSLFVPDEDETGPVITLEAPDGSEVLSETVVVSVTATDDEGVAGLELFVDDRGTGLIDTTAPYTFDWDTEIYENGSSHMLYVQGWDVNDNYSNSDTVTVTVDNASAHPAPIDALDIEFQITGNVVQWNMSLHEKFAAYSLRRSEKSNMDSATVLFESAFDTDTLFVDTSANPLKTYYYQVMIVDIQNYVSVGAIVESPSPDTFLPNAMTATTSDTTIRLRWNDNSSFEGGFILQRDEGAGFTELANIVANTTEYEDIEMVYDKQYRYRIAIYYQSVTSKFSDVVIQNSPLQFAPSGLAAMATPLTIQLRWDDNCTFEAGYRVERDAGLGWTPLVELGANATSFEDTDLGYDIAYDYRVAAFTETMQSSYSTYNYVYSPLEFAPVNLAITTTDTSILLTWEDRCLFENGFIVERGEGSITGYGYIPIDTVAADVVNYTDFDIEENAWYYYRVAAYTEDQRSSYSSTSGISSPLNFAPTSLTATVVDTSIQLRWTDNCIFEDGFILERDAGTGFEVIAELGADTTGYMDSDMTYGVVYQYRVAATAGDEQSEYSFEVSRLSPLQFHPTSLSVASAGNNIQLVWNDNSTFETGYIIERDAGAGYESLATLGPNNTSYLDTDMTYDVIYRYRVAAFTDDDISNYTYSFSIQSPLRFSPSSLFAFVNDNSIDLSWEDNCIFESGFYVERDAGSGFVVIADLAADVEAFSDTDLVEGVTYRYRVAAYEGSSISEYSFSVTVGSPIVFAPVNLVAVTQANSIDLSWVDNCNFEQGFTIERDGGAGFVEIADLSANFTFYSDEDLEYYTVYRYRVAAYTDADQSNYTPILNVQSPVEITPSNLVATSFDTEIHLEWQDNSDAEEGFRVYRDDGTGYTQLTEVSSDVTTYTDYDLVFATEYRYQVSAFANSQESDFTNEVTGSIGWLYSEWRTIDAGTYSLGHVDVPSGEFEHVVGADFEIMSYEVTNIQYAAFIEEAFVAGEITYDEDLLAFRGGALDSVIYSFAITGHQIEWDGTAVSINEGYDLHPVVGVTWFGAEAFADHYGWSLPTEEQWEVAARADTEFDYPWGNNDPTCDLANFSGCSEELVPVGQTSGVSPWGIYDMVGNAWEWTDSFYDGANDSYVIRGGSWSNYTDNLKVWYRSEGVPVAAFNSIGFRCVR